MNPILDIILAIPLVWAVWAGFRNGIVVQLGGIAGLLVGVWFAVRHAARLGAWLDIDPSVNYIVGFAIILILVVVGVAVIGRLLRGVFRFAGLAVLDRFGGAVLSLLKIWLVLGLLLYAFDSLNRTQGWVAEDALEKSLLYRPLTGAASFVFPYIEAMKTRLLFDAGDAESGTANPARP